MLKYFLKRLAYSIVTILIIITVLFFVLRSIPGGPFTRERPIPDAILRLIEQKYNLDAPLYEQYFDYLIGLFTLDLGPSYQKIGTSVNDIIASGFPHTLRIGFFAALLIIIIGIPVGIISALKMGKPVDYMVMFIATLGVTLPSFVVATLFIFFFAGQLGWVPPFGIAVPAGYIGPVLALSGYSLSFVARLTRSSMLEVLRADYIQTARANGLNELSVIAKHAVKNAIIPVITYMGPTIAAILTGSVVVERIFAIPGIGRYFVESVTNRDYTTYMAVTILFSVFYVFMILLVDVAYALMDPRIRFEKEKI